jgi:hypothetical protein
MTVQVMETQKGVNIATEYCYDLGYNGANVKCGVNSTVQTRIKQI